MDGAFSMPELLRDQIICVAPPVNSCRRKRHVYGDRGGFDVAEALAASSKQFVYVKRGGNQLIRPREPVAKSRTAWGNLQAFPLVAAALQQRDPAGLIICPSRVDSEHCLNLMRHRVVLGVRPPQHAKFPRRRKV